MNPANPFHMVGRTTLVTGGTQGVGAAICKAIAQAGGNVLVHGLSDDSHAQATLAACRTCQVQADLICGNLLADSTTQSVEARATWLADEAFRRAPNLDTLVNNVGTYGEGPFPGVDAAAFYQTMQLNVAVGFFLTREITTRWIANGTRGRILFTGSINGLLAEPAHVCYDASKGAVAAMVRSLCVELAPHGIRVNSIAPGLVRTPLTNVINTDDAFRGWMEMHTPNRQVPEADVCGPPAVFLLSDAAQHVHGQTLYVDGGMSVWQQPDLPSNFQSE